jgi:thioredoxin-dependent peroxiredoxin
MQERTGVVTFKSNPMTLTGTELKVGDAAPAVTLTGTDLSPVNPVEKSAGKPGLFITVPSVDTSVCSLESKKFSDAVKTFGDKVAVFVISADLPFALKRWCAAEGVDNLTVLSDYRNRDLASAWGLGLKELDLLTRAVYVTDKSGNVTYREIVPEVAAEPNYDAALAAVREAL